MRSRCLPVVAGGRYTCAGGLTDGEHQGNTTERLVAIKTLHTVRIAGHRFNRSIHVEFLAENPDREPDPDWDGQHACDGASARWNTFLDPVVAECAALPLEQ